MLRPLIVLGCGGHAAVLVDILRQQGRDILALVSPEPPQERKVFSGLKTLSSDDAVLGFNPEDILLVNGLGSLPGSDMRRLLHTEFCSKGYQFASVIADQACISAYASLAPGVQVLHGAIIQAGACIGENTIVNTAATIDHDCQIGADNHVAPGVTLSGGVRTGCRVHLGTGAKVIQSVSIGSGAVVGAGAIVTQSIPDGARAYGSRVIINNF